MLKPGPPGPPMNCWLNALYILVGALTRPFLSNNCLSAHSTGRPHAPRSKKASCC